MEKEALEAVWQWKFKPAMKDGKAIEAEVMLPIKYKLS
jgi:outer membrane biosynthesis protein TonB